MINTYYLEDKKTWTCISRDKLSLCIIFMSDSYIEIGYCLYNLKYPMLLYQDKLYNIINTTIIPKDYIYNKKYNCYIKGNINLDTNPKSNWSYTIPKLYSLSKLHQFIFNNLPEYTENTIFKRIFDFSYGLEFETSNGYIPGNILHNVGLIPLYDGSISGYEYVTFPVNSDKILEVVNNTVTLLNKYTEFNKECAIHLHIGNIPVSIKFVSVLISMWTKFQYEIAEYLPGHVYDTGYFKSSGKNYCNSYPDQMNFKEFYNLSTGNTLVDDHSLYLPNQYDSCENAKWNVHYRYFNMNIMHLISGNSAKTIEFRFLSCTKYFSELELWIIILSAFVKYVMKHSNSTKKEINLSLKTILSDVYTIETVQLIMNKLNILKYVKKCQENVGDHCGLDWSVKKSILDKNSLFNKPIFLCAE